MSDIIGAGAEADLNKAAAAFADRFGENAEPEGDDVEIEASEEDVEEDSEAETEEVEAKEDDDQETGDEPSEEEAIAPPTSWSDADKEVFKALTPEAQRIIADRETARDNYLRNKSGEFAEAQRQLQAKVEEAVSGHQERAERLDSAIKDVESLIGEEPDWSLLRRELDRDTYEDRRDAWDRTQLALEKAREERTKEQEQARKKTEEAQTAVVGAHWNRLLEIKPEFKDQAKFDKTWTELDSYLASKGFEAHDRQGMFDSRLWDVALDALAFSKLEKAKTTTRKTPPKKPARVQRPGTANETSQRPRQSETMKRLQQKGSVDAAADAFGARFAK